MQIENHRCVHNNREKDENNRTQKITPKKIPNFEPNKKLRKKIKTSSNAQSATLCRALLVKRIEMPTEYTHFKQKKK